MLKRETTWVLMLVIIVISVISVLLSSFKRESENCPISCDDNNPCTRDYCSEATNFRCRHDPIIPCEKFKTAVITKPKSFAPGIPIKIESILPEFNKSVRLNDEIQITFRVSVDPTYGRARNVTANVSLPEGLMFAGGNISWNGNLEPDSPINFEAKIKIFKIGNWTLEAVALYPLGGGSLYLDREKICFSITQNETIIAQGEDACLLMLSIPECKDMVLPDGTIIKCSTV
jgi:hypothetical protein